MPRSDSKAPAGELAINGALGVLAALFTVFAALHRWYNDDTFITFRYSWNLAHGNGFAWNPGGPHVEGSTSFGWTLVNAVAIAIGLDPVVVSWTLGIAAGIVGLWLVYRAGRDLLGFSPGWALVAPALLACSRQYVIWAGAANETRAATVLALAGTLLLARELRRGSGWSSGIVFFLATLCRPEMPLLHLAAGAGFAVAGFSRERRLAIARSGAVHAVLLLALVLFRLAYFGHPLPNTFYAKVGALQFDHGLSYLAQFPALTFGWLWAPLLLIGLGLAASRLPDLAAAFLVQIVALTVWIAAVGGDAWEFRFLDPLLPAFALLLALALDALRKLKGDPPPRTRSAVLTVVALAVIGTQAATLFVPFTPKPPVVSAESMKISADEMLAEGRALARYLEPADRIATGWAGAIPYVTHAWHFDPWGLNEADVASWPFDRRGVLFHQRQASWDDVVRRGVVFVDIYNQFLFDRPYPPYRVPHPAMPWAKDGVLVYCIELPQSKSPYWIFASPKPRDEIESWAKRHGLRIVYSESLRFRPGSDLPSIGSRAD